MQNKVWKSLSSTDKATLIFSICAILQKLTPFLLIPILTRGLSTEDYGRYIIYQSWVVIITVLATLNLHLGGFNNGLVHYPDYRIDYTVSIVGLCTVISCLLMGIWALLYFCFHLVIIDLPPNYVVLLFAQIIFSQGFLCWSTKARYEQRLKELTALTAVNTLFSFFIPLVMLYCNVGVFIIILGTQLPGMVIGCGCFFTYLIRNRWKINTRYWKKALSFNVPLIPHYIASVILAQIDRIMIQDICGMADVALYGVAYNLSIAASLLTNSFNAAVVPDIYEALKQNNTKNISDKLYVYTRYFALFILGFMVVLPEIISIITPGNYSDSINAVPPIELSCFFTLIYYLYANVEFYYESRWFISASSGLAAVLNLILNAIYIPKFGYYAAAYTTLVCYIVYAYAHMLNARRLSRIHHNMPLMPDREVIRISIFLCICMFIVRFVYPYMVVRYGLLCLIIVAVFFEFRRRQEK